MKENNLSWNDYKNKYLTKSISVGIDETLAMNLLDNKYVFISKISKGRKYAHKIWSNMGFLLLISFIITTIMWFFMEDFSSWYPIISIIGAFLVIPAVRKSASQFIIQETLENESFYCLINDFSKSTNQEILIIR